MIRSLFAAAALLCALAVAGCQTTGTAGVSTPGSTPIVVDTTKLPAVVAQAQARVVQACGFLPTARTVAGIIATFRPSTQASIDLVETVVAGVCAAANGGTYASLRTARAETARGTYRGVRIRGRNVTR